MLPNPRRRLILAGLILLALCAPSYAQDREPADLVLVSEDAPWLLAIAAPALGKLAQDGKGRPQLLAAPERSNGNLSAFLARRAPRSAILLTRPGQRIAAPGLPAERLRSLSLDGDPFELSLRWAREIWGQSERVVLARFKDPEALILASALAAREGIPVLAVSGEGARLTAGLKGLGAREALTVAGRLRAPEIGPWSGRRLALRPKEVQDRIIRHIGAGALRSLVLSRSPERSDDAGDLAWLLPAWTYARRAAPILLRGADPRDAEKAVYGLIKRGGLAPRTLCILASHQAIGLRRKEIPVADAEAQEGFIFEVEPCAEPRKKGRALSLGVGRVPLARLSEASLLFARGLDRERSAAAPPRALMMANALPRDRRGEGWHPSIKGLPLCEIAARLTTAELRNHGVAVADFRRISSAEAKVVKAASRANLVIFQGHVGDQLILEDRAFLVAETLARVAPKRRRRRDVVPEEARPDRGPPVRPARLEGRPLVILQSCRSLERHLGERVFRLGGVGLIGSVTFIHSASGSAFIDALIDAALARGATLGEALRDARNDFLLLQDLKNRRGHKEQAKSLRVALSFRLWGDPELALFAGAPSAPRLAEPRASWTRDGALELRFPGERYPELANEDYHARFFAGSRSAGLVRREAGRSTRALAPLYGFRVRLPEGLIGKGRIKVRGGGKNRLVHRVDEAGRTLVLLYFPKEAAAGSTRALTVTVRERKAAAPGQKASSGG